MGTHDEYLKGLLQQIDDSHTVLTNLNDKSGDLEIIKRDLAKITGLLQVLSNKIQSNEQDLSEYLYLVSPVQFFLANYDFFREIDTMTPLYSEDPMRLKNMRLTILDALDQKNLIGHIKAILREHH